jgi:hypothetical protein
MQSKVFVGLMVTALLVCATAPAEAQWTAGIRAGASADPGQFFVGGHVETRPIIENLTFRPNLEVGVGDNVTTVAINLEFAYWITLPRQAFRLYFGAGPAAVIYSVDDDGPGRGNADTGGGFNFLVGAQHRQGLFGELKLGLIDSPEVKVTVGYVFR